MMPTTMIARAVPPRTSGMGGFGNRNRRRIAQICSKHQDQRRNYAKGEKRVESGQHAGQVAASVRGEFPGHGTGSQSCEARDGARAGRYLQPGLALRANHVIGARCRVRRANFRPAMRANSNGHEPPPKVGAHNNRNRDGMETVSAAATLAAQETWWLCLPA